MAQVFFYASVDFLRVMMHLPKTANIVGAFEHDNNAISGYPRSIGFIVEDSTIEGGYRQVCPTFHQDANGVVEFIGWEPSK
jgi:hypothetical protein